MSFRLMRGERFSFYSLKFTYISLYFSVNLFRERKDRQEGANCLIPLLAIIEAVRVVHC